MHYFSPLVDIGGVSFDVSRNKAKEGNASGVGIIVSNVCHRSHTIDLQLFQLASYSFEKRKKNEITLLSLLE